ncbi:MAG: anaerobic ribonucleoside-triphosphate reductase activating protein [Anaerolineaceae bacterium]|nr:anaerobic ribonucleoside-triphosphate reductase activating protein [Anaerolineaceae bacterium]
MPTIAGFSPLSLIDDPGYLCCSVFLCGCPFRCPFCHNAQLWAEHPNHLELVDPEQLLHMLEGRISILDSVCLTGAEPLSQTDLPDFTAALKKMGYRIKLDTNGYFPERLEALLANRQVDKVAMDIKNSPQAYAATCGLQRVDLARISRSIQLIQQSGVEFEFRTTLTQQYHPLESLKDIVKWNLGQSPLYLQNFQCQATVPDQSLLPIPQENLQKIMDALQPVLPGIRLRING